jgi:hypothetical protein
MPAARRAGSRDANRPTARKRITTAQNVNGSVAEMPYTQPQFGLITISAFAGIGLALVLIGIFSVMAYICPAKEQSTAQRCSERLKFWKGAQPDNREPGSLATGGLSLRCRWCADAGSTGVNRGRSRYLRFADNHPGANRKLSELLPVCRHSFRIIGCVMRR